MPHTCHPWQGLPNPKACVHQKALPARSGTKVWSEWDTLILGQAVAKGRREEQGWSDSVPGGTPGQCRPPSLERGCGGLPVQGQVQQGRPLWKSVPEVFGGSG